MKIIIQSLAASFIIHLIYMVGIIITGYVKTNNYQADIANSWDQAEFLQSEVIMGTSGSPFYFLYTFIGAAFICGIVIFLYRKRTA